MRDVHAEFRAAHAASLVEMVSLGLRPASARGGSTGRLATLPGADPATEEDAARTNAVISSGKPDLAREWASLYGDPAAQDAWWAEHEDELGLLDVSVSACERIRPPDRDEWSQTCIDAMAPEGASCRPVCLHKQTVADFEALMAEPFDPDDYYIVDGDEPDDPNTLDFLAAVWKFIVANTDLLEWAACWADFERQADCLVKRFTGAGTRPVKLRFYYACEFDGNAGYEGWSPLWPGIWNGGLIKICLDSGAHFRQMKNTWVTAMTSADRVCAIIAASSAFAHEMTHVCGSIHIDRRADCEPTQLIETAFEWALLKRYSFASAGQCCSKLYSGDGEPVAAMFGSKMDHDPTRGCA